MKHGLVKQLADWPYSSFHRYVRSGMLPTDGSNSQFEKFRRIQGAGYACRGTP